MPTPGDVGGSLAVSSWSKWQPSSLVEKASWRQGYMRVSTIVDRKESNGEGAGLKFMRREMKRKIFDALIFYLVHLDTIEGRVGQVQCGNGSQLAARPVFTMSTGHRKDCIKSVSMNALMSLRVFIKKKTAYDGPQKKTNSFIQVLDEDTRR